MSITILDSERWPIDPRRSTRGGDRWRNEIATLANGKFSVNEVWSAPLGEWQVNLSGLLLAEIEALRDFFYRVRFTGRGFRFRDPVDHTTGPLHGAVSATDMQLGIGDGATAAFNLVVTRTGYSRRTFRPRAETFVAAIGGTPTTAFTLDPTTGVVTFDSPPANLAVVTAGWEFDKAAKIVGDRPDLSAAGPKTGDGGQLVISEIREVD